MADERQKVETFARNTQFVRFWVKKGKTTGISFDPGLRVLTLVYLKRLVFDFQKYLSVYLMHEIIRKSVFINYLLLIRQKYGLQ